MYDSRSNLGRSAKAHEVVSFSVPLGFVLSMITGLFQPYASSLIPSTLDWARDPDVPYVAEGLACAGANASTRLVFIPAPFW